ncbi:MAG: fused MFS/spermidine synthase [Gammaproteobacteria bacterium]
MLYAILFIEGFVSIALEILTIRQLMPFVGSSVVATSLIIGVFLLFLAFGYFRGGQCKLNFTKVLQRNFVITAAFAGLGLSYFLINILFSFFSHLGLTNTLFSLSAYLLLITAPMIYFIGQTIPITMNLVKKGELVGNTGGKVLFLNTLGSFLGATITTLVLTEYFGVTWTVYITFLLTTALFFLLPQKNKNLINKESGKALFSIFLLIVITYITNISLNGTYFNATTNYANYSILQASSPLYKSDVKLLEINRSFSSLLSNKREGFPYVELIKRILFKDLALKNKEILVLGAGGFTMSAQGSHSNNFTYVDIDPKIKEIAENGFIEKVNGSFIAADARSFMRQNNKSYDVIISDTYSHKQSIPAELLTIEYLQNIKHSLSKNGLAIFNIIENPLLGDKFAKHTDSTIRYVFKSCSATPLSFATHSTNIIYVCQKNKVEEDNYIYSDDKNRVTLESS